MQPGIVGLRGAITAAWEEDLRAVRQDRYDTAAGKEALAFIQRCYSLVSDLRAPIQKAWGSGGHVHVADSASVTGPGPRVSQTRMKLRNHGDFVVVEAFSYADGTAKHNPSLGLDREIRVVGNGALSFVQELYRTTVDFLQVALNLDLALGGSAWLYEQAMANHFMATGKWLAVGEVYQSVTRELAVEDSFERVVSMFGPHPESNGSNGSVGGADVEVTLTVEQLHRCRDTQGDLENFVQAVRLAVTADQENRRLASDEVSRELTLEELSTIKLGRMLAASPEVCREGEFAADFTTWSVLPSYNVHFFRRANTIDEYVVVAARIGAKSDSDSARGSRPPTPIGVETASTLPDGIVTFLMTDVVESTSLWIQGRAQMYSVMRRHDQLLTAAIESNGGIVLKERGEGDSFFAVFLRATDAVIAALDAQKAILSEPWREIRISVRMAILTGEADAQDRDYRSPAVNRCAKLRRRAVGNQVLVSESTYSIVADILRDDVQLVSTGKRRLEGHERPEEIYVLQHPEVVLETLVAEDEVLA